MEPIIDPTVPLLPAGFPLPFDRPFTTAQARQAGVTRDILRGLLRQGALRRVLRGVFVAATVPDGLLVRAQALVLVVPTKAAVKDWTACWLWTGVLPFGEHPGIAPVSIFRFPGSARLRNDSCRSGERTFRAEDLTEIEGVTVTTPLRTALDIGRLSSRDNAIVGLDALLRHGSFGDAELLGSVERFARQRGVVQLRALAPLADPRAESAGESVLRLRWLDVPSLPRPTPQIQILDALGREAYRLDLGVEELRFGMEYDGEDHHSLEEDREHDDSRRRILARRHGWVVKGVRRHNVFGRLRDVESVLHNGIDEARRKLGERRRPA